MHMQDINICAIEATHKIMRDANLFLLSDAEKEQRLFRYIAESFLHLDEEPVPALCECE